MLKRVANKLWQWYKSNFHMNFCLRSVNKRISYHKTRAKLFSKISYSLSVSPSTINSTLAGDCITAVFEPAYPSITRFVAIKPSRQPKLSRPWPLLAITWIEDHLVWTALCLNRLGYLSFRGCNDIWKRKLFLKQPRD